MAPTRIKCYWKDCRNNKNDTPEKHFFKIPEDSERCKLWLNFMGRQDLMIKSSVKLHNNFRVCEDHFEEKYFTSSLHTNLNREAIPHQAADIIDQDATEMEWQENISAHPGNEGEGNLSINPEPLQQKVFLTPKRRKIRNLRVQLHRLRARALKIAQQKQKISYALQTIKQAVPGPLYELVRNCVSSDSGYVQRSRWSPEMKTKGLNIYLQSPGAYRMIRKLLNFPSKPTLLRVLRKYATDVGFNEKLFDILRGACSKMSETDKLCCLMWDEISLKANLSYNSNEDIVDGFERYSANSSSGKIANQSLVFMVRGVCNNYKQVLGYFLANSCTPGNKLQDLIRIAIEKLNSIGLKVVATVCDQGSNNQKAYNLLGVSSDQPFFKVNNNVIVAFFDTPHLIKSTRNMFKKYSVQFEDFKVATWKHIEEMYEFDKVNKYRLTKITDNEVYVSGFRVMRVRTAARVLSHSVAAAINCLCTVGKLSADAAHTAEFIANIDKAFDSLNGRVMFNNMKPLCGAVKELSNHHSVWDEMANFFNTVKFVNNNNKTVHAPSTKGWVQNFHAAKLLWEVVKKEGMHSLLMGRINQDCLENTFCTIRNKGGNRDNPSCNDFRYAFRAVAAQNMLKCSDKGNCDVDYDVVLASVGSAAGTSTCKIVDKPPESQVSLFTELSCNFSDLSNNLVNNNAMFYVAGYLAKKICSAKQCCGYCCTVVIDPEKLLPEDITFPIFKEYEKATNGLQYPSTNLLKCVKDMTDKFDSNFRNLIFEPNVTHRFANLIQEEVSFHFLSPTCNCKGYLVSLFTRMLIHARLRKVNAEMSNDNMKRKKKMKKVMHQ